jgi:hypothetical protein
MALVRTTVQGRTRFDETGPEFGLQGNKILNFAVGFAVMPLAFGLLWCRQPNCHRDKNNNNK